MTEVRRVAILGGTFDPVHNGHLAVIEGARDALGAAEGWLVPARLPALRAEPVAPVQLRVAMLEAAVRTMPRVRVDDVEVRRSGVSYTMETLEAFRGAHPGVEPWLVLGSDAVRHIREWHRADELIATVRLGIVQRRGNAPFDASDARRLGLDLSRTRLFDITPPDVSATEVRRRVSDGQPITAMVPPAVAEIIAASGLYRSASPVR